VGKFERKPRAIQPKAKYTTKVIPQGPVANSVAPAASDADENSLQWQLACRLREAYRREARRHRRAITGGRLGKSSATHNAKWDGGRDDEGFFHKSVWVAVADKLIARHCLAPERFVQAQFLDKQPIKPNMLKSEEAWDRFTNFNGDATARLKSEFKAECVAFEMAQQEAVTWFPDADKKDIWRFVLRDTQSQLSALFRFCVALSEQLGDIAAQFQELAMQDYLQNPQGYDYAWGTKLPDSLKKEAENILSGLERKPPC
jgi:hypothetical protein